jgi:hypothetical protein
MNDMPYAADPHRDFKHSVYDAIESAICAWNEKHRSEYWLSYCDFDDEFIIDYVMCGNEMVMTLEQ